MFCTALKVSLASTRLSSNLSMQRGDAVKNRMAKQAATSWHERERRVEFDNMEGATLVGDIVESASTDTVVLCPGNRQNRNGLLLRSLAERLDAEGKSTLRFDFSGAGESEGTTKRFDIKTEVKDIRSAVDSLKSEGRNVIGLIGHSRGAADVLLYASLYDDIPKVINIAGYIASCTFLFNMDPSEIRDRLKRDGKFDVEVPQRGGMSFTTSFSKEDMERLMDIEMEEDCKKIVKSRVLSIIGTEDGPYPLKTPAILDQCIRQHETCIVEGAEHFFADPTHLQILMDRCVAFLS